MYSPSAVLCGTNFEPQEWNVNRISIVASLSLALCACVNRSDALECPSITSVKGFFRENPLPLAQDISVVSLGHVRHRDHRICYFVAQTIWGESRRATTRLVLWSSNEGLVGWFSLPGIQLTTIRAGVFGYLDSEGKDQTLDLATEPIPARMWIDGAIVDFTLAKESR